MASPRLQLKKLVGEWKGRGTVRVHGETFPIQARWTNELVAAGFGLRCEARMTGFPGAEEFVEVEQIGYDDYEQQFHMSSVCIFGETHDMRGDWQDEALLVKDDREAFHVKLASPEKLQVHVENAGGGPVWDLDFER